MTARMLIDASHLEETRVVLVSGNRLEDFDYETREKSRLKGNIYLAKVTRVEPSLQAAFVDYGGNRHGFLAFNEIHPDYYRIPISDREEMLRQEAAEAEAEEEEIGAAGSAGEDDSDDSEPEPVVTLDEEAGEAAGDGEDEADEEPAGAAPADDDPDAGAAEEAEESEAPPADAAANGSGEPRRRRNRGARAARATGVATVGGDEIEDIGERRRRPQRRYRIQEVISRRQIILIQVAKEERGNKGAAITSYISLAGRYCVLMPNTPRGGGISRKIASAADRKRLKKILDDFDIPDGMAVIVRTAGASRTKAEIRRDYEYLLKLWDEIRERTLQSTAPALIHEEGNLIKRSIRDLYTREIDEVLVEGDEGYRTAKDFMKLLIPSHAKRVKAYKEPQIPLFQRYQVEAQIDNIQSPVVQLKSGGSIVLNSTEALVAIDVNSGRATRERNIEETALKTNLEAADEVARQLRLRDLAGLIVIDFIDMEDGRNRHAVERRLKNAMASDRARIQIGRISAFGLLEMSRQRLRPSVVEVSSNACPTCGGTGLVRSIESTALSVLRAIEEEGTRQRAAEISVSVPSGVAFYIFNRKRAELTAIEERYDFQVVIEADDTLVPPDLRIEKTAPRAAGPAEEETETAEETDGRRRRRRGGRRRRADDPRAGEDGSDPRAEPAAGAEAADDSTESAVAGEPGPEDGEEPRRRRRGRRGGRKRRGAEGEPDGSEAAAGAADTADAGAEAAIIESPDDDPAPAEPAADEEAPAADGEAAPAADTASGEAAAGNGRRRRSPRKRAAAPASDAEAAPADDAPAAGDGADEPAAPAEAEAKEPAKPKRPRRTRAKAAAPEAEAAPAGTAPAEPVPADSEAPAAAADGADAVPAATNGSGAAADPDSLDADEAGEAPAPAAAEDAAGPAEPKRRGWWNVGR